MFGLNILHEAEEQIPMEEMDSRKYLTYQEYPIKFLETSKRVTRNNRI
jgi:hypothetical protein